jgi:hypothetical protein
MPECRLFCVNLTHPFAGKVAKKKEKAIAFLRLAKQGVSEQDLRSFFKTPIAVARLINQISKDYKDDFNWIDRLDVYLARLGIHFRTQEWQPRLIQGLAAMSVVNAWVAHGEIEYERKSVEQLQAGSKRQSEAAKKAAVKQNFADLEQFLTEIVDEWAQELTPTPTGRSRTR